MFVSVEFYIIFKINFIKKIYLQSIFQNNLMRDI